MSVDEQTIELAGSPVFVRGRIAGGGAETIVYLHGMPTSSDDWIAFLERTGGIAPDLIGFGRSGKGGHLDYSAQGHADFLAALLDRLGVGRVILVLHDWGAAGGLVFAERNRDRVSRLVMCNAVPLFEVEDEPRLARLLRRPGLGELVMGCTTRSLLARTLRRASTRPDAWSPERIDAVWRQFDQGTQRAILRLHRSDPERVGAELGKLEMPALVLWGEEDPWRGLEVADGYCERLPHARLERIAGAGHWPWLDDPGVIERVASFIAP